MRNKCVLIRSNRSLNFPDKKASDLAAELVIPIFLLELIKFMVKSHLSKKSSEYCGQRTRAQPALSNESVFFILIKITKLECVWKGFVIIYAFLCECNGRGFLVHNNPRRVNTLVEYPIGDTFLMTRVHSRHEYLNIVIDWCNITR